MLNRTLAIAVQDALEAGDSALTHALVDGAVDGGGGAGREARCPLCNLDCRWPGALEDHLRNVHWIVERAA